MKEMYKNLEIEIVEFETEDVIVTSGGEIETGGNDTEIIH